MARLYPQRLSFGLLLCVMGLTGCPSNSQETDTASGAAEMAPAQTPLTDVRQENTVPDLAQRCARSIEHIALGIYPEQGQPLGAELAIIQSMIKTVTKICIEDGLTLAQSQCLMAARLDDHLQSVRTCLGPRDTWPRWFSGAGLSVPKQ